MNDELPELALIAPGRVSSFNVRHSYFIIYPERGRESDML